MKTILFGAGIAALLDSVERQAGERTPGDR